MDVNDMLGLLRENLNNNLWKIVNGEMVKKFDFNKYMRKIFEETTGQVRPNDEFFIENRADEIRGSYNKTLQEINKSIIHGNILKEKKRISQELDKNFKRNIRRFVNECEDR